MSFSLTAAHSVYAEARPSSRASLVFSLKEDTTLPMATSLLLDIGNTTIKACLASAQGLGPVYTLPTVHHHTPDSLGLALDCLCQRHGTRDITEVVASSVVPPMDPLVRQAAQRFWGCPTRFVLHDIEIPLENRYARPQEVGADRLLAAYAARMLFSAPTLIVVDFGTATTFDCIHENAYLGGLIAPGVASSVTALSAQTAKLPHISLALEDTCLTIGTSTRQSMNHGILFGFAAMVEGLVARLRQRLEDPAAQVVATGGFASTIARITDTLQHLVPDLLLRGLQQIAFSPIP